MQSGPRPLGPGVTGQSRAGCHSQLCTWLFVVAFLSRDTVTSEPDFLSVVLWKWKRRPPGPGLCGPPGCRQTRLAGSSRDPHPWPWRGLTRASDPDPALSQTPFHLHSPVRSEGLHALWAHPGRMWDFAEVQAKRSPPTAGGRPVTHPRKRAGQRGPRREEAEDGEVWPGAQEPWCPDLGEAEGPSRDPGTGRGPAGTLVTGLSLRTRSDYTLLLKPVVL